MLELNISISLFYAFKDCTRLTAALEPFIEIFYALLYAIYNVHIIFIHRVAFSLRWRKLNSKQLNQKRNFTKRKGTPWSYECVQ